MSRIEISIFDQNAVFTNLPDIFSGDVNVDTVKFVFDNSWNDFSTKTAVFYNEPKNTYMQILDENGIATIPYEVMLNKTRVSIGVFGTNANGDVKTSQILTFGVGRGAIAEDMTTNPATPDVWLQILTSYDEIKADFEDLSSSVDSRINTMGNKLNTMENTLDEISESIDTVLAEAELIGDISELETTDKSSLVNAINESVHTIDGIPVDLTGIYNTQVIGFDETQGKLVPMINVARKQEVIPNASTPVPWAITETINCINTNNLTYPQCSYTNTGLVYFKGYFTTPFVLSEFTTFKAKAQRSWSTSYVSNWIARLNFSKTSEFQNIDAQFVLPNSYEITGDITNLNGIFYIGFEVSFEPTDVMSNIEYTELSMLSFSQGGTT